MRSRVWIVLLAVACPPSGDTDKLVLDTATTVDTDEPSTTTTTSPTTDTDTDPDSDTTIDMDGDGWSIYDGDCDDTDDTIYPGAPELCNGTDDDCDGLPEAPPEITELYGPTPYLAFTDSPFYDLTFDWFYLEDVEDHLVNEPGLSAPKTKLSSDFVKTDIDSVDADDGVLADNDCLDCDGIWGAGEITLDFDEAVLGTLPTHVGLVWVDGFGTVSFWLNWTCGSEEVIGPVSDADFPDADQFGGTAEDRFFGMVVPEGVSSMTISNTIGGIEADHIQYGVLP